jgi:hypothetical protein
MKVRSGDRLASMVTGYSCLVLPVLTGDVSHGHRIETGSGADLVSCSMGSGAPIQRPKREPQYSLPSIARSYTYIAFKLHLQLRLQYWDQAHRSVKC